VALLIMLLPMCTFQGPQVLIMCRWHESLHGGFKVVSNVWHVQKNFNRT
jgi:hypothetical protein